MKEVFALLYWDYITKEYDLRICDMNVDSEDPLPHPNVRIIRKYIAPGDGSTLPWNFKLRQQLSSLNEGGIFEHDLDQSDYDPVRRPSGDEVLEKYSFLGSDWVLGIYRVSGASLFGDSYKVKLFDPKKEKDPRAHVLVGADLVKCYRFPKSSKMPKLRTLEEKITVIAGEVEYGLRKADSFPEICDLNDFLKIA